MSLVRRPSNIFGTLGAAVLALGASGLFLFVVKGNELSDAWMTIAVPAITIGMTIVVIPISMPFRRLIRRYPALGWLAVAMACFAIAWLVRTSLTWSPN